MATANQNLKLQIARVKNTVLNGAMLQFKGRPMANKTEAMVTVDVADNAQHQRVVDVLNVCAQAEISGVTFAGATEDAE